MMAERLKPAADIAWAVELRGVTLFSRRRNIYWSIPYPYAGLWAMLADGTYSLERARDLMALLTADGDEAAEHRVVSVVAAWRREGLLDVE